jgi:ABC-2 type transport system ATP-binding protein
MTAIQIEGLVKQYGNVRALDGLDLNVAEGAVFGFLGPNGAGKTTTLRILAGLARATAGKALIAGQPAGMNRPETARLFGYLPEDPVFYPWMNPSELLDLTGRTFYLSTDQRKKRALELLERVNLLDVRKRRIGGFSRGMRQRLGLAQALMNHPPVLLLDEPVSALDPIGRKEVLELIESLRTSCTIFMSTHILADVERVCDSIAIIHKGRLVVETSRQELQDRYALPLFRIEVSNHDPQAFSNWSQKLKDMPGITAISTENAHALRLQVDDVDATRQPILSALASSGLPVERFEVVKPSLEDVFLKLVGAEGGSQ